MLPHTNLYNVFTAVCKSHIIGVKKVKAQGTVLGPILLIFYINEIVKCVKYLNISLFADDCVIYLSGNNWDSIHRKIQRDFDCIVEWTSRAGQELRDMEEKRWIHRLTSVVPRGLNLVD